MVSRPPAPAAVTGPARWAGLACALLAILIYLPALPYAFVYDDVAIIENNTRLHRLGDPLAYLGTSWWNDAASLNEYRPLPMASFALNYALTGPNPAAFRLVNMLLHGLVTWLLWRLALTLGGRWRAAAAAALIFAVHPLHVEVVSGIVGRAELMMAACFLAGLLAGWHSMVAPTFSGRRRALVALFAAACGAMFSKEHGVLLPPALVGLLFFAGPAAGGVGLPAGRWPDRAAWKRLAPALGVTLVAFALMVVARILVLGAFLPPPLSLKDLDNPLLMLPRGQSIGTALSVFVRVVQLHLLPFNQSPDYSYGVFPPIELGDPLAVGAALLLALLVAALWPLRSRPLARLGLWLFLVTWLITSNLVLRIGTILGERLLYLPSAGYCLLLGALLFEPAAGAVTRARNGGAVLGPPARGWQPRWIALGLYLIVLLALHFVYLPAWRSQTTLVAAMLERVPQSGRAQMMGALAAKRAGDLGAARERATRALQIYPANALAMTLMAELLAAEGRTDNAIQLLVRSWRLHPLDRSTAGLLLRLMGERGQTRQAVALLIEGIYEAGSNYRPRLMLAELLLEVDQREAARSLLQAVRNPVAMPDRPRLAALRVQVGLPPAAD